MISSSRTLVFPQDPAKVGQDYIWKIYPSRDGWEIMGEEMRTAISDTEDQCRFQWYEYIYGKYDKRDDLQSPSAYVVRAGRAASAPSTL